jgi:hypothetical protein
MDTKYLGDVVYGAWRETKSSFSFNKKTVATGLLVAAGLVVTLGRSGWAGVMPSLLDTVFAALTLLLAASILFGWNIIETQAKLYHGLAQSTSEEITNLRVELERYERPLPDYNAWRHKEIIDLRTAAQLWCDERPSLSVSGRAGERYNALAGAIQKGREEPHYQTLVTRDQLKSFAKLYNYDPVFLRDA